MRYIRVCVLLRSGGPVDCRRDCPGGPRRQRPRVDAAPTGAGPADAARIAQEQPKDDRCRATHAALVGARGLTVCDVVMRLCSAEAAENYRDDGRFCSQFEDYVAGVFRIVLVVLSNSKWTN